MWELRDLDTGDVELVQGCTRSWRRRFVATSLRGYQYWYKNELLHREDGPAVIYPKGTTTWYSYGDMIDPPE